MAITDVLAEIKNYFLNWHTNNYTTLHTRETNQVTDQSPDKDYLVHSGAIKAADDAIIQGYTNADTNLQNQINNLNNNKLDKTQNATASPITGIKYATDVRGFRPAKLTSYQNGVMTWRDKAELQSLGRWYECVPGTPTKQRQIQFKSIEPHSIVWVNPALRIVYLRFYYRDFNRWAKGNKEADIYMATKRDIYTEAGDPAIFWYQIRPMHTIWSPTNIPYIQIGVDSHDGIFKIRSSEKVTSKKTISGSLFWFYGDFTSYDRWQV